MNTRQWVDSIPEIHRSNLETYSNLIVQAMKRGRELECVEYAKLLRGYLTCMKACEIITESGLKALYLWYRSSRVTALISEDA